MLAIPYLKTRKSPTKASYWCLNKWFLGSSRKSLIGQTTAIEIVRKNKT